MASPVSDFTSLDFDGIKASVVKYAQEKFAGEGWTDFNSNQFAMMLLDCMAYIGDLACYQVNALSRETVVSLLTRMQNFRNIAKYLNYRIPSATPATGSVVLTLANPTAVPFELPQGTRFSTTDSTVFFETMAPVTVTASPFTVAVTEGRSIADELTGIGSGTPNQRYQLLNSPTIDGTLSVYVGGVQWTEVGSFAQSAADSLHYVTSVNDFDMTTVQFGNGLNGAIPDTDAEIRTNYRVGGGARGNVARNMVTVPINPLHPMAVTNPEKMNGGANRPTLAQAKMAFPLVFAAQNRAVTGPDYIGLATTLPGVAKARVEPSGTRATDVVIYVAPTGGGYPSPALRGDVVTGLQNKKTLGTRIIVGDPYYQRLHIALDVYVLRSYRRTDVVAAIQAKLLDYFSFDKVDFGQRISLQALYLLLAPKDNPGIDRVVIRELRFAVLPRARFGHTNAGTGTLTGIEIGDSSLPYEWNIEIVSLIGGIHVQVTKRYRGEVSDISDNLLTDISADFVPNSLAGRQLFPVDTQTESISISGNTESNIYVDEGLLGLGDISGTYAISMSSEVQKLNYVTVTSIAGAVIGVPNASVFTVDEQVSIINPAHSTVRGKGRVTAIDTVAGTITLDAAIAGTVVGDIVSTLFVSADGSLKFSILYGNTAFSVGDKWFIDTYPYLGDLKVRPQDIPTLAAADLEINSIGGTEYLGGGSEDEPGYV